MINIIDRFVTFITWVSVIAAFIIVSSFAISEILPEWMADEMAFIKGISGYVLPAAAAWFIRGLIAERHINSILQSQLTMMREQ